MRQTTGLGGGVLVCALAFGLGCAQSSGNGSMSTVGVPTGVAGIGTISGPTNNPVPVTGTAGGGGQIVGNAPPPVSDGVPCAVATVITNQCTGCHGSPTSFGAPMSMMKLADFHAAAKSNAARKVFEVIPERINATEIAKRMPPSTQDALAAADLKTLNDWVSAGAVASSQSCAIMNKALPGTTTTTSGAGGAGANQMTTGNGGAGALPGATHMGGANNTPIAYDDPLMKCYKFMAHAPGDKTMPYQVDTTPDMYTNFMFMPEWTGMMYARSYDIIYGNKQVIHHWLFYKDAAAGTDGDISPSTGAHPDGELVHGWAPGGSPLYLDPDVGVEMPSDVAYTLETHHNNTTGATAPDASGIEICVTPTVPTNVASLSWLGTDGINGTMASGTCAPTSTEPIHIIGAQPHMHTKGIRMTVDIMRAGGMMEKFHDAPFDFQNQHSYDDHTIIMPGDSLTTTCYYNAPASFGERTSDEMCYFFTLYYPKLSLTNGNPVATLIHGPNTCLN